MKNPLYLFLTPILILGCVMTNQAIAVDMGIFRANLDGLPKDLTLVSPDGGKTLYQKTLKNNNVLTALLANKKSNGNVSSDDGDEKTWTGDFLSSNDGLEYVKTSGTTVGIYTMDGEKLGGFKISEKANKHNLGVGDVFPEVDGQEIIVCRTKSKHARIKVFSYDESKDMGTQKLSFTPFQEAVDADVEHGCGGLDVVEIDAEQKIIATQLNRYGNDLLLYVYNTDGELEKTVEFEGTNTYGYHYVHFDILDFTGDGSVDDAMVLSPDMIIYNLSSGKKIDAFAEFLSDYSIGNIDGRVGDEIVTIYGKKSYMLIWNGDGKKEVGQLYPNTKFDRNRKIVITDYSSLIHNAN